MKIGHILTFLAILSLIVTPSCDQQEDSEVTTYTTIEEQSSNIDSEGGQIQLGDGANVVVPPDSVDEDVRFTFSRKSAGGELPSSIEKDPDSKLISDFYFLEVDKVLDQNRGITLEFPFELPSLSEQVRVIEVFNIGNETYPRFVDATVDETSGKVIIEDTEFFPTAEAIQEYETEFPPTNDTGFHGMAVSLGYAALADTSSESSTLAESVVQLQSGDITCSCSVVWGRIRCIGERAEVTVNHLYGTGDAMKEYACSALRFAESIQEAYSSAGFETHDKILVHITMIGWLADGVTPMPGSNKILIRKELGTGKGGPLNLTINHETVHTMQSTIVAAVPWWKESSADWIAYYFEPDEEARQKIRGETVLFFHSVAENPFLAPFPPLVGDEIYDYSILIDYAVEAGEVSSGLIVTWINVGGDPTEIFEGIYRDRADGFAQYLAEEGLLKQLAYRAGAETQLDGNSPGSVELSIDASPLTLQVKRYHVIPPVVFRVSLTQITNDGGIVIGYHSENFTGLIDDYETSLTISQALDIYLMSFARGSLNVHLELLLEWEPWPPEEFTLTVASTTGGLVTAPGEGTFTYDAGTVVDLVAEAEEDYQFVNWSGDVDTVADVNAASTNITMNDDYSITASFDEYTASEYTSVVAGGSLHTVGLKAGSTVVAVGYNYHGQCNVGGWTDIVRVAAGYSHTLGLKADGTVVAVGRNDYGQCDVGSWTDIVQAAAGVYHTVGVRSDGTVVAVGVNNYGQCNVGSWTNIVQVAARYCHTVGLKADGTVVAVGWNYYGECNVGNWTDIVQVAAGERHTVGLKADGTVVAVGRNEDGECNAGNWTGIVQVAAGRYHTVGVRSDGTVVAVGYNYYGQCNIGSWTGIVQVAAGGLHTVGLESDGTVVAMGRNDYGQCDVGDWTDIG